MPYNKKKDRIAWVIAAQFLDVEPCDVSRWRVPAAQYIKASSILPSFLGVGGHVIHKMNGHMLINAFIIVGQN